MAMNLFAESTKTIDVTFKDFIAGKQYADNEEHILSDELTIYTTDCHFTTELRIYSSTTYNGYVVSNTLPGHITKMVFNVAYASGYDKDKLNVYGSTDGSDWKLIKVLSVESTTYSKLSVSPKADLSFRCFKLDVEGENQIRIKSMSITYITDKEDSEPTEPEEPETPQEPGEPTEPEMPSEPNDGSKSKPFTVADLWNMSGTTTKADKWIIGTIYGTINNYGELNDYGSVSTSIVI